MNDIDRVAFITMKEILTFVMKVGGYGAGFMLLVLAGVVIEGLLN